MLYGACSYCCEKVATKFAIFKKYIKTIFIDFKHILQTLVMSLLFLCNAIEAASNNFTKCIENDNVMQFDDHVTMSTTLVYNKVIKII